VLLLKRLAVFAGCKAIYYWILKALSSSAVWVCKFVGELVNFVRVLMGDCFVFVLQECSVCLMFRGGESQRGILSLYRGYSGKAPCTGEPALHAMKRGGGRHFTAVDFRKQDQPKTNLLYIVPLYKGAIDCPEH